VQTASATYVTVRNSRGVTVVRRAIGTHCGNARRTGP
jgi:hypothetical protein